jgi:hypothetical protein
MNGSTKFTMITPPFSPTAAARSSGMLRRWGEKRREEECDRITGASVTRSTSQAMESEAWERSTNMPSLFISLTTSSPKRVSPPCSSESVAASAQSVLRECVRVM